MKIHGLQKMTLLDFPGHVACTVFLGGCDFRCPFCHNFQLVDGTAPPTMETADLLSFLETRRGILEGVAITGGEPCLQKDLPELCRAIKALGYPVKLDTNGTHPAMLAQLIDEGLVDYVAMDIKNSKEKYAMTCGLESVDITPVEESVRVLLSGNIDYEFRTTVVKEFHTAADFQAIASWIAGAKAYYLQSFTDRDTVPFAGLSAPDPDSLKEAADIVGKTVDKVEIRGVETA